MFVQKMFKTFPSFPVMKMSGITGFKNRCHTYRIAMDTDKDNVLEFLYKHFYPNEPTSMNVDPNHKNIESGARMLSYLRHGTSIKAVENETLIGLIISGPIGPGEGDKLIEKSKVIRSKQSLQDLQLISFMRQRRNIYKQFNASEVLHIHGLVVDQHFREASVSHELFGKLIGLSKLMDYQVVSTDCTSSYAIRLAEKSGAICVSEVAYSDYKDSNGSQIFKPPLPHTHINFPFVNFLVSALLKTSSKIEQI